MSPNEALKLETPRVGAPVGNRSAQKWQPEHDEFIKLHREHNSCARIAVMINDQFGTGYSRNAVVGRLHRLGLTNPLRKAATVIRIRERMPRKPRPATAPKPRFGASMEAVVVPLRCVDVAPRNLSFNDLKPGDCRYPAGDRPFTFCGRPQLAGLSYCGGHARICFGVPVREKRGR